MIYVADVVQATDHEFMISHKVCALVSCSQTIILLKIPYCLELRPVSYKRLVSFSHRGIRALKQK